MKSVLNKMGICLGFALVWSAFAVTAFAGHTPTSIVPEIDAGALTTGLVIVAGGYLVLMSRLRRK